MDIGSLALEAREISRSFDGRTVELIDMLNRVPALNMADMASVLPAEAVALSDAINAAKSAFIRFETALLAVEGDAP